MKNNMSMPESYGYYVFLGHGDYHQPEKLDLSWTSAWGLSDWKEFLRDLASNGANTLMVYLTGHQLPYKSAVYPELVQPEHPNVKEEFFSKIIELAGTYRIKLIGVLSTTGHAGGYLAQHPELGIRPKNVLIDIESLLCSFPHHIRKKKHLHQKGSAQVGAGVLCHNNIKSQEYAVKLIRDCISIYNKVHGIALHPPESIYPCYCEVCCAKYFDKYGKNLLELTDEQARCFYIESYFEFQVNVLKKELVKIIPDISLYTFSIPWFFENNFERISQLIPKDTIIIEWDYNLSSVRVNELKDRLKSYKQYGHQVWFMPTAGFGFQENENYNVQAEMVFKQINTAKEEGVTGVVHFVGPRIILNLRYTNYFLSIESRPVKSIKSRL